MLTTGETPLVMGILNVTPDSFSDGGLHHSREAAVRHGLRLVEQGADILDIGGESTRPGSEVVDVDEELHRTIPVIEDLAAQTAIPISIDTTKSEVAQRAINAGAKIVNDISGLEHDPNMVRLCADNDVAVIAMHMQGTPQTMQENPRYDDVVQDIAEYLRMRIDGLVEQGVAEERIAIDPGIGFGKTAEHNIDILSHVGTFRELGRPVLIGHSRKRLLSHVLGREVDERVFGTVGVSIAVAMQSADLIRVHDVQATHDAIIAWRAIASQIPD